MGHNGTLFPFTLVCDHDSAKALSLNRAKKGMLSEHGLLIWRNAPMHRIHDSDMHLLGCLCTPALTLYLCCFKHSCLLGRQGQVRFVPLFATVS